MTGARRLLVLKAAWPLGAIILLGALLRFETLADQSYWYDEADTREVVARGLGYTFSRLPETELNPPLYYVLLWLWARVFGLQEAGLRSFSAVCGTLTIPVMWAAGRQIVSNRVGLVAALLVATSPLMVWYSQEARNYALLVLLSALSIVALIRVLQAPTTRRIAWWAAACSLTLCTHYFSAFVIGPEVLLFLAALRSGGAITRSSIVVGLGPIAATGLLVSPLLARQVRTDASFILESASLVVRSLRLLFENVFGYGAPPLALCAVIVALMALPRAVRAPPDGAPRERLVARLPVLLAGLGIASALVLAAAGIDYFSTRNLLPTWPAVTLAVAIGLGAVRAPRWGAVAVAILAIVSVACIITAPDRPGFQRADWRGVARALGPAGGPRAIVSYDVARTSLGPYMGNLTALPSPGVALREVAVVSLRGAWVGTVRRRLVVQPLEGFEIAERRATKRYTLVRYRSRDPRLVRSGALRALYPGLPNRRVLLQRP